MDSNEAIKALGALSQEHRLAVFRLLVRCGSAGMSAGLIAQRIGIASTALSFHLKELENAGLAASRREGRYIYYSVIYEGMRSLLDFLLEDCCQGEKEICAPLESRVAALGESA